MVDIRKDFLKFKNAWNTFAGLRLIDESVEAIVPQIDESTKVIYCCLTQKSRESPGYVFFLILKLLAQL